VLIAEQDKKHLAEATSVVFGHEEPAPLHPADGPKRLEKFSSGRLDSMGSAAEVKQYWDQYKKYYQYIMTVDRTTHDFYFRCMSLERAFRIKHFVMKFGFL
jgi:hypothetical protein